MTTIFRDEERTCVDCKHPYMWTEREQRFSHEKGYFPPKRCSRCRALRKQQRGEPDVTTMNHESR